MSDRFRNAMKTSISEVGERKRAGYIDANGAVLIIGNSRVPVGAILEANRSGTDMTFDRRVSGSISDICKALDKSVIKSEQSVDAKGADIKGFDTDHEVSPIAFITIEKSGKNGPSL